MYIWKNPNRVPSHIRNSVRDGVLHCRECNEPCREVIYDESHEESIFFKASDCCAADCWYPPEEAICERCEKYSSEEFTEVTTRTGAVLWVCEDCLETLREDG